MKPAIYLGLLSCALLACGSSETEDGSGAAGSGASGSGASGPGAAGSGGDVCSGGAGEGGAGGGACTVDQSYDPLIVPADFGSTIDNPFYPLPPGTTYTFNEGTDVVTVLVTDETKVIMGVTCVVVRDTHADENGDVIEDTFDWYAQDKEGNVWYFGEDTKEYDGGQVVSTAGSWEGGVDGAKPGIVMKAAPAVGDVYRQEYYACEAEDYAEVLDIDDTATVPLGSYTGCIRTHDYTPLDMDVNEEKTYCAGVGLVLALDVNTNDREELVSVTP
ncbi:MAG: hypothetical protein WKG00_05115 [Polyangiaceae bacterium]